MNLPESISEVASLFNQEEFVLKTIDQIKKDLSGLEAGEVNFNINFDQEVLNQLTYQLMSVIQKMESRNIQQFIYRVDLKESQFLNAVSKEDEFQELAYLIIRREAQKVYLRSKFA